MGQGTLDHPKLKLVAIDAKRFVAVRKYHGMSCDQSDMVPPR